MKTAKRGDAKGLSHAYLEALRPSKKLGSYDSHGLTSKMWLLPNARIEPIGEQHCFWLKDNPDVCKKFELHLASVPDEYTAIRLAALNVGFIRINYTSRNGELIVEANTKYWTRQAVDAIFMLVVDSVKQIYSMRVDLLNEKGQMVRQDSARLFNYDDAEKLDHLPLISKSKRGRALRSMTGILPRKKSWEARLKSKLSQSHT